MAGPLQGIRVIDVTTNISGPSLTMILADLGADVIKVERPGAGDDARMMGPLWEGEGVYYLHINRNKRSIVVDLKQEEGQGLVQDFVKDADVFVENFRLGKAEQIGLGYEQLKRTAPQLIYCSISAYGQSGPKRHKPGYDAIVQADAGLMGMNGSEEGEVARIPVSILDQGSAMWGALGVVAALYARNQTGKGQKVDTSLYETGVFWTGYHLLSYLATGEEPVKMGSNHAAFAPYGAFKTKDDLIMIGVSNNNLFARVCRVLGKEEWINDVRFCTNPLRVAHRKALNRIIEDILKKRSAQAWMKDFESAGVPSSVVKTISDVLSDEQTKSTQMLVDIDHPKITGLQLPRLPLQFSETGTAIKKAPPLLGEDTLSILRERGISEVHIKELLDKGVIEK